MDIGHVAYRAAKRLGMLTQDVWFATRLGGAPPVVSAANPYRQVEAQFAIEVTSACNANCVFCAYQYQKRRSRVISDETFTKALNEYAALGGGDLGFCCTVGDPLLDRGIVSKIRSARAMYGIGKISIITNLIGLHKIGVDDLIGSGVSEVNVSTSGFDPEAYLRIYRVPRYEQMRTNLLTLLRRNRELGGSVRVNVSIRTDRPFAQVAAQDGFCDVVRLADSVSANMYYDSWGGRIKQADLPRGMRLRSSLFSPMKRLVPCAMLWTGFAVKVDGTVTACSCRDIDGDSELVVGNITTDRLSDLINGVGIEEIRRRWAREHRLPGICVDCSHYTSVMALRSRAEA